MTLWAESKWAEADETLDTYIRDLRDGGYTSEKLRKMYNNAVYPDGDPFYSPYVRHPVLTDDEEFEWLVWCFWTGRPCDEYPRANEFEWEDAKPLPQLCSGTD